MSLQGMLNVEKFGKQLYSGYEKLFLYLYLDLASKPAIFISKPLKFIYVEHENINNTRDSIIQHHTFHFALVM